MGTPTPFRARYGIQPRVVTLTDAATVTPNTDITDIGILTSLSQTTTFANPTGSFYDGQLLQLRITSSSSRAISFGTAYQASSSLILPIATTGSNSEDYIAFRYNSIDSKWDLVAATIGAIAGASTALDAITTTQGSLLYRNATNWVGLAPSTAGYFLQSGGSGANPSWVAPEWTSVTKGSDESRTSNTTPATDGALTFTPPSTGFYELELYLVITCTAGTGGLRAGFTIPTNALLNWNARNSGNSGLSNSIGSTVASSVILAANAVATQMVYMTCNAQHTDVSGAFTLQWAQNASSANSTTIKAGSILRWRKVA